jgi:hypothetical protein
MSLSADGEREIFASTANRARFSPRASSSRRSAIVKADRLLDTPFPKIAAAMQVLIENGVKVLGLPMDEGLLVLTDRGFAPRDDVSMPESFPGLE